MAKGTLRASTVLAAFFGLTLPLMPVQALLLRVSDKAARRFPNWYHRQVCRILGIRLQVEGAVAQDAPVLLVCNHTSWLDIPVLSALAPVSFVAKLEVGSWPFVSALARLQRSVFIDRTRRLAAGDAANAITRRLQQGDTIVLFAEGTSSDGNRVLPFKTSLFGAVAGADERLVSGAVVQTVAVVYTHLCGVPLTRADRPRLGWYGDMEMTSHAWGVLKSGAITATVKVGAPVPLGDFKDRKDLALKSERAVRRDVLSILRGRMDGSLVPVEPSEAARRAKMVIPVRKSEKWT
ncbi:lysophospholipid acyltransferase family protein [Hyphomicrobium sp.]|jgi:1-acyl-sn-glycerol-3-phosphate acyltransferase|uniref:lysophospholipid acyltransferase family protein n=1 Tax=Hyphomicrobium sp. TaxID=82 RepID=UPI002CE5C692|nr:lysophospholipid acyltransferase family protein [Hyphomicrobium sp.]HVZ05946.1 lysophospholipid acyltransferase family protein [Hyphomicrobium sp.]